MRGTCIYTLRMALEIPCSSKIGEGIVMDGFLTIRQGSCSAMSMTNSEGVGEVVCKPIEEREIMFEVFFSFCANCGF